ncbi:2OG-Fe dioxygenase family protein [Streptomyces sp. NPDC050448]|uniref:2OG-Fe dioxygenase family protein n=1 Tax=Streptomyces sp. NPDC050448 TaxID=3155404 RepID=UPI00342853F2
MSSGGALRCVRCFRPGGASEFLTTSPARGGWRAGGPGRWCSPRSRGRVRGAWPAVLVPITAIRAAPVTVRHRRPPHRHPLRHRGPRRVRHRAPRSGRRPRPVRRARQDPRLGGAALRRRGPATGELAPLDHVAYYQGEAMNAFVGGIERHFGDVEESTYRNPLFQALVRYDFDNLPVEDEYRDRARVCQIHQIRIEINPGKYNELVPEGIHSDGYPWAGLHLISRVDVEGGHSTVFTWDEEPLAKGTFLTPLDSLIFEDRAMEHHVTGLSAAEDKGGYRDVLAISFSLPGSPYETLV